MAPGREPLIFNIQRFSIHDGPGIRTTVFFKGCPLRCVWCHNPKSQSYGAERMYFPERCVRCGRCAEGCQAGVWETVGRAYMARELCAALARDRMFYALTRTKAEMGRISAFVRDGVRAERIYLLPYHRLGSDKAGRLDGRAGTGTAAPPGIADLSEPYAEYMPAPFLSVLTNECIKKGMDYIAGGARTLGMPELLDALARDFEGHERLRARVTGGTPKYGNDDDEADGIMRRVFSSYMSCVVRVAGYSDYFRNLSRALQDEIIARTEQE